MRTSGRWFFVLTSLAIAIVAPMPYLTQSLQDLADGNGGLAQHYVDQPAFIRTTLIIHASFSGLALLLTPIQFSSRIRRRWMRVHRVCGRISFGAIMIGALSGLVIAQVSYAGLNGTIGFSLLALVWLTCAVRAIAAARQGDIATHREWAFRTIAMTYAAVTLRIWLIVMIAMQRPGIAVTPEEAFDNAYPFVPFLSWVPNLLIAEWILRRRSQRNTVRATVAV
jgi:uncharacterized membrane protein